MRLAPGLEGIAGPFVTEAAGRESDPQMERNAKEPDEIPASPERLSGNREPLVLSGAFASLASWRGSDMNPCAMPDSSAPALSFVIPLYNSAATIRAVVEDIEALEIEGGHEIVLVNDGSSDATR